MSSGEAEKGNWSAAFQRLRAEVVFVAVLLAATALLNLNFAKVPFIGIELTTAVPRGLLLLFLWVFFGFLAVNWMLKYVLERSDQLLPPDHVDRLTHALGAAVNPLGRDFTPDISLIKTAAANLKSAAEKLTPLVEDVIPRMLSDLREAKIIRDEKLLKELPLPDESQPLDQKALLQIKQHENESIGSPFSSLTHYADQIRGNVRRLDSVYQILDDPIARLKEANERNAPILAEIKKEAAAVQKALKVGLKSLEKRWFGFFLPFGASMLLAGLAIPQSALDIIKLFDDGDCGAWLTHCLYRAEPPSGPVNDLIKGLQDTIRSL